MLSRKSNSHHLTLAAPDVNLYLAMSSILSAQIHDEEKRLELPKSYAEALERFEELTKDSKYPLVDKYYLKVFEHELKEHEEYFSDWEATRIY